MTCYSQSNIAIKKTIKPLIVCWVFSDSIYKKLGVDQSPLQLAEMAPNAKVLSTKLISVLSIGARLVKVGYVDKTDAWNRIYLSSAIQEKFKATSARELPSLKPETDMVALQ